MYVFFHQAQLPISDASQEYDALAMDWDRKRSLDSDQHPFLPRRQSIYAQTPVESRAAPEPDVPLGDYVRGSRDDICIAPWLIMGPPPAPRSPAPLKKCLVDFSEFTFSPLSTPPRRDDDDYNSPPPSSTSSGFGSGSNSVRSECNTPMTTPERDYKPLPRRSTSPPGSPLASRPKFRAPSRAPSPASSSLLADATLQRRFRRMSVGMMRGTSALGLEGRTTRRPFPMLAIAVFDAVCDLRTQVVIIGNGGIGRDPVTAVPCHLE